MNSLFLVMIGGAAGAGARHMVARGALVWFGPGWPWGTFGVNIVGGFAMGVLAGWLARQGTGGEQVRLLVGVGVLGGFTTFSAFSLDTVLMVERGAWMAAGGYIALSVIGSIAALFAGLALAKAVSGVAA